MIQSMGLDHGNKWDRLPTCLLPNLQTLTCLCHHSVKSDQQLDFLWSVRIIQWCWDSHLGYCQRNRNKSSISVLGLIGENWHSLRGEIPIWIHGNYYDGHYRTCTMGNGGLFIRKLFARETYWCVLSKLPRDQTGENLIDKIDRLNERLDWHSSTIWQNDKMTKWPDRPIGGLIERPCWQSRQLAWMVQGWTQGRRWRRRVPPWARTCCALLCGHFAWVLCGEP
jgi:hypothetical protein